MSENEQKLNQKLVKVLGLLDVNQKIFGEFEDETNDQELKKILLEFVRNDKEYASELLSNLSSDYNELLIRFGARAPVNREIKKRKSADYNALFERCKREENAFERAYREVLNTWYVQEKLKRMMQFQLNEIKVMFLKIRIYQMEKNCSFSRNVLLRN